MEYMIAAFNRLKLSLIEIICANVAYWIQLSLLLLLSFFLSFSFLLLEYLDVFHRQLLLFFSRYSDIVFGTIFRHNTIKNRFFLFYSYFLSLNSIAKFLVTVRFKSIVLSVCSKGRFKIGIILSRISYGVCPCKVSISLIVLGSFFLFKLIRVNTIIVIIRII